LATPQIASDNLLYPVNPPRKVISPPESESKDSIPADPGSQFLDAYKTWKAGESLIKSGKSEQASDILLNALIRFTSLRIQFPHYEPKLVSFKIKQVSDAYNSTITK